MERLFIQLMSFLKTLSLKTGFVVQRHKFKNIQVVVLENEIKILGTMF